MSRIPSAASSHSGRMRRTLLLAALGACGLPQFAAADDRGQLLSQLQALSIEELLDVEVLSVSKRPERLGDAASAIQVISREDIRRSGATSIPEALRLAPNLQVAQVNASQWAISARGFNNVLANKLLVLIDGRVVYTPLFAGVFWDVQDVLLDDIERIEVISGPGGTLWGSNAVNGVINIITKVAAATQGLFSEVGSGTEVRQFVGLRYGGQLAPAVQYRIYGKSVERDDTVLLDGRAAHDDWETVQAGGRLDWTLQRDVLTFQADAYSSTPNPEGIRHVAAKGGNLLAGWQHTFSPRTDLAANLYFDRTRRDLRNGFEQDLDTTNIDVQLRWQLGRQQLVSGLEVRQLDHETVNLALFRILPANENQYLYSAFINDEITLVPQRLRLTIGSKFEDTHYTNLEYQPSARLAWTPDDDQLFWGAVSRAVRTPSRIDRDFFLNLTPAIPLVVTGGFDSEELLAYELGWRGQPRTDLALSAAAFYNVYDKLRSAEPGPPPLGLPLTFLNGVEGDAYGLELTATCQPLPRWRLRGGYTYFHKDLRVKPTSRDLNDASVESNDPEHQLLVQSTLDLGSSIELDWVARYVDRLPNPRVPSYVSLDLRLGWQVTKSIEVSLVGQSLLEEEHLEFIPASPAARQVERSFYARFSWRP